VYPKDPDLRQELFGVYSETLSLPPNYEMYARRAVKLAAVPEACRMYVQMGCAFVMNQQIASKAKADWMALLNGTTQTIRKDYIEPITTAVDAAAYYAGP
jgi:hypothetical protein